MTGRSHVHQPADGQTSVDRLGVDKVEECDVVGVGIGPFNLGLAALLAPVDDVDAVFLDARGGWAWHPGLLLDGTTLQVPFLADLVTLADPTSPYSFLNYLHRRGRLYRFYFYERFHVPRQEYDDYCRWVAEQLPSCRFNQRVVEIRSLADGRWSVLTHATHATHESEAPDRAPTNGHPGAPGVVTEYRADAVVLGVGTRPALPSWAQELVGETVFHSADYLSHRDGALAAASVTVVGSGQSAAEVFADLLANRPRQAGRLDWFTRSRGFLPMEYSKLGLEHFTPEYTAYFHGLSEERRDLVRGGQDLLYKGISSETSEQIYDVLYEASIGEHEPNVGYRSACELRAVEPAPGAGPGWRLTFHHLDDDLTFHHDTDVVVLATGYEPAPLPLSPELAELVERDSQGRPMVDLDYRLRLTDHTTSTLYVQNAELHTHGVGTPDLGLGAHRNAVLVNALTGRETYPVRDRNVFQSFGTPPPTEPSQQTSRPTSTTSRWSPR